MQQTFCRDEKAVGEAKELNSLLIAANAAQLAGFTHLAGALVALYLKTSGEAVSCHAGGFWGERRQKHAARRAQGAGVGFCVVRLPVRLSWSD